MLAHAALVDTIPARELLRRRLRHLALCLRVVRPEAGTRGECPTRRAAKPHSRRAPARTYGVGAAPCLRTDVSILTSWPCTATLPCGRFHPCHSGCGRSDKAR